MVGIIAAMIRRVLMVVAVFGVAGACGFAQTRQFTGKVSDSLKSFEFTIHITPPDRSRGEQAGSFDRIEVRSGGKAIQTIEFAKEDGKPVDFEPLESVTFLKDVNCDGYKDLLVRKSLGLVGDAWYFLFRFDPSQGRFVPYPPFSKLAYKGTDCPAKLVNVHVNTGGDGCYYESATYHWVGDELEPLRIEDQSDAGNRNLLRIVRVWRDGKEAVESTVTFKMGGDCHAPHPDPSN